MLTDDKTITTPEYWDRVYNGKNNDAKVDASNTKRPANTFDRFDIVVKHAEGPAVLDIASGHAHICKRIKALHPSWFVQASDQSAEAKKVANFEPYAIIDAYNIPFPDKFFQTIIITQALEYLDDPNRFMVEARRVAKKLLLTVPDGEMSSWSQLRIYRPKTLLDFLYQYGTVELLEMHPSLILAKLRFP